MSVMMNQTTTSISRPGASVAGAAGFLGAFLVASPISDAFADRPMPLPTATASETAAYFAANPLAVTVLAGMQVVSVACFAVFVAAIAPLLRDVGRRPELPVIGYASVAAMAVSSLLAFVAAAVATSVSDSTVDTLRQASFYAGGVANVVLLGVFVFGSALVLGRAGVFGRPVRVFGYVAGTIATLSILSLGIYYATALLPIGRVLSMIWTVVAAIRIVRARPAS
jgi:hypothetical protein